MARGSREEEVIKRDVYYFIVLIGFYEYEKLKFIQFVLLVHIHFIKCKKNLKVTHIVTPALKKLGEEHHYLEGSKGCKEIYHISKGLLKQVIGIGSKTLRHYHK